MTIFWKILRRDTFSLRKSTNFIKIAPMMCERIYVPPIPVSKSTKWSIYLPEWVVHKFFGGVSGWVSGGISVRARPAHTPDIALAGKNPMSVALTERYHKSQDIHLLGKKKKKEKIYKPFHRAKMKVLANFRPSFSLPLWEWFFY